MVQNAGPFLENRQSERRTRLEMVAICLLFNPYSRYNGVKFSAEL